MGTYTAPPSKAGKKCVVKKNKASYVWDSKHWTMSRDIQSQSKDLALKFNKSYQRPAYTITFTDVTVECVVSTGRHRPGGPKVNEYILVEDYIPGNFTKWCNNYGYISSDSQLLPAFMHWTWVHTGGKMMIADLQGVRNDVTKTYILTDPVLLSNTVTGGQYGCTDTGVEGMAMFFLNHSCNSMCQHLPRPRIGDVVSNTRDVMKQLASIMTSTAYSHELKLPNNVKTVMITRFPQIASRRY